MIGQDPMAHDGNVEGVTPFPAGKGRERSALIYCPFVSEI